MEITKEMLYAASQAANHQQLRVMYDAMKDERDAYLAELQKANAVIIDLQRNAPKVLESCLRQVRADAGRDGFIAGYMLCNDDSPLIKHNYEGFANQYHASILAGKE